MFADVRREQVGNRDGFLSGNADHRCSDFGVVAQRAAHAVAGLGLALVLPPIARRLCPVAPVAGATLATFLLLALLAEIAGTVGGFGSSVFFVPVANVYFDFQSVLGITALFHLASNISKLGLFRGGIDRGLLLRLGVPSVLFAVLGGLATAWFPNRWLEATLAVFLRTPLLRSA